MTRYCVADEQSEVQLHQLTKKALIDQIETELRNMNTPVVPNTNNSLVSKFCGYKKAHQNIVDEGVINQNKRDLNTALEILNKESPDAEDINTLSAIVKNKTKTFVGQTSLLLNKVEKLVYATRILSYGKDVAQPIRTKQPTHNQTRETEALRNQLRGQRDACLNQKQDRYLDKYVVLCVALAVLDNKASMADLNKAKQDYPKYNEGLFLHRTASLVERTLQLCQDLNATPNPKIR